MKLKEYYLLTTFDDNLDSVTIRKDDWKKEYDNFYGATYQYGNEIVEAVEIELDEETGFIVMFITLEDSEEYNKRKPNPFD